MPSLQIGEKLTIAMLNASNEEYLERTFDEKDPITTMIFSIGNDHYTFQFRYTMYLYSVVKISHYERMSKATCIGILEKKINQEITLESAPRLVR